MARRKRTGTRSAQPNVVHPEAAGIDIGARELYVAVRPDRDSEPIRSFRSFTSQLHALARWLQGCHVKSVAMESTGVYWIPVYQILEHYGFDVVLVNARHVSVVPGRKSDVADCEWLRYLHSVGLLRGSFRPADEICRVRTLLRHRDTLVKAAAKATLHMQKAMDQMNVHLNHAITDITGLSGLRIIDAILAGERDPARLADLAHPRIRTRKRELLIAALEGNWRDELLFTLRQARETYAHFQQLLGESDQEIAVLIRGFERSTPPLEARASEGADASAPAGAVAGATEATDGHGPDVHPRHRGADRPGPVHGSGTGSFPLSQFGALRLLAGLVSQEQDQRWQGDQFQHRTGRQPGRPGSALGHPDPVSQPIVSRAILPPAARPSGHAGGDSRHRA